ncbi:uncharacterized protein LOC130743600 [Lotus japonicus]|uniref:uncharacterized protein LOC130743600 n=1 Tax=Lotus japonicus TaxID=34305 RepID=UPI002584DBF8|nr:uncharacterized protein LOC130743600 [Lotus japonicus]
MRSLWLLSNMPRLRNADVSLTGANLLQTLIPAAKISLNADIDEVISFKNRILASGIDVGGPVGDLSFLNSSYPKIDEIRVIYPIQDLKDLDYVCSFYEPMGHNGLCLNVDENYCNVYEVYDFGRSIVFNYYDIWEAYEASSFCEKKAVANISCGGLAVEFDKTEDVVQHFVSTEGGSEASNSIIGKSLLPCKRLSVEGSSKDDDEGCENNCADVKRRNMCCMFAGTWPRNLGLKWVRVEEELGQQGADYPSFILPFFSDQEIKVLFDVKGTVKCCMTRANPGFLHPFISEIDREFHRFIRARRAFVTDSHSSDSDSDLDFDSDFVAVFDNMAEEGPRERTLRELAAPDFTYESLCIQYPEDVPCVLKTGLIHLLPKFGGLAGEDPHMHIKEFRTVISTMKPPEVDKDHICLKAFPHSLQGTAKTWLYNLPPSSIASWDDLKRKFLEKFFPASRTTSIRKDISGIRQLHGETLHEYWERFKTLCVSCPHHQISEQLLVQYFYEGLLNMERHLIDAACGGALNDMTPTEARQLFEKMAANSQQFQTRSNDAVKTVNEIGTDPRMDKLEKRMETIASLVTQLAMNQNKPSQQAKVCGICTKDHNTDVCPSLQEPTDENPEAYAANIFNNRPQQNYDLSSNRYNPGWRNHPNLRWSDQSQPAQAPFQNKSSLEDMLKQMTAQNIQFQQDTRSSIQNLTTQIGQMATSINQLQSQNSDKLPSQTVVNPRNVSAITLRSGKQIDADHGPEPEPEKETETTATRTFQVQPPSIPLPFPPKAMPSKKKEEVDTGILEIFKKVEVNIPLLDALKQIPRYAKFLKELCTQKRKLKGNERVRMGRNVSAIIGKASKPAPVSDVPEKCEDPGTFSVPCVIGDTKFENAMLDLGASINVMPMSIFKSLSLGPLKPTGVVIQLANRSTAHPAGWVEDVLVRVGELVFPADFYVLEMEKGSSRNTVPIILGRPFLKTARTKIDVYAGTLTMEFGDIVVRINIFDAMKHPPEDYSVFHIDLLDELLDDMLDEHESDFLHDSDYPSLTGSYTCHTCTVTEMCDSCIDQFLDTVVVDSDVKKSDCTNPVVEVQAAETVSASLVPSVLQAPVLELKPLPDNLKYAYLEDDKKLPVIVSSTLHENQEEKLLQVLRKHNKSYWLDLS